MCRKLGQKCLNFRHCLKTDPFDIWTKMLCPKSELVRISVRYSMYMQYLLQRVSEIQTHPDFEQAVILWFSDTFLCLKFFENSLA